MGSEDSPVSDRIHPRWETTIPAGGRTRYRAFGSTGIPGSTSRTERLVQPRTSDERGSVA